MRPLCPAARNFPDLEADVSVQWHRRVLTLVTLPAILVACSDSTSSTNNNPEPVHLRAIHATPSLGGIDVLVDGTPVITGLAYGQSSEEVAVAGGTRHLVVRSGADTLADGNYALALNQTNNLVIADSLPQFTDVVVPDTGQPSPLKANLRLVNVVGTNTAPPTALQVRIHAPNPNPDSVVTSNIDATIATYWSLMYFDPGSFTVQFVPAGEATVLAEASFDVTAGEKKQVVLSRSADGGYHVQVVTEP